MTLDPWPNPEARYDVVAFTHEGKVYPAVEPEPLDLPAVMRAAAERRGAVAYERERRRFYVFDLHEVDRWWLFFGRAKALAWSLWFVR